MMRAAAGLVATALALGCSSSARTTPPSTPTEATGDEIGRGDGTPSSVTFTEIYVLTTPDPEVKPQPVDLAFNPADPGELWVVSYSDDAVHVGFVDGAAPEFRRFRDPAAGHFMYRPPALAMGDNGFWGTCGDNDNSQNPAAGDGDSTNFMGPALFTTDRSVFAKAITQLGSHYDMLHSTPFCRGIAHVEANWYWVFNAFDGSLDKYNFAQDHGPGEDDHSDGEIYRYAVGQVKGVDGVPSHVVYDPTDAFLYVADTGNARVVRLDTRSGTKGARLPRRNEPLAASAMMDGTAVEEVVPPGTLQSPSGIEVRAGLVYVTDTATSTFHVFRKDGTELRRLATGLPAGALAGFTFGVEGKVWFTDRVGGRVLRIDP